ncbi:MAG: hypothetical protein IJN38_07825 [Clostridia bacterium]|nr:hypothetical protein [Clostridia bacterium]
MNQKFVRIVAIILAVIIAGGVLATAFTSVFAADAAVLAASATPDTGTDGPPVVPIVVGIVAVLLIAACVIIPKVSKK